ncbi:MAG: phosphate/phosphite/phosphonate ABC transporter substrate-binding protein [Armatimonadetes bacterium]|nr:phosphate/phosphite/phosphonate ABC transporter substrate-binding protein [Armatimonadota bacterium]
MLHMPWMVKAQIGVALLLPLIAFAVFCGCGEHRIVALPSVKVALEPEYPLHIMAERYNELMSYLGNATKRRVEWISAISSESMIATIEARKPDIALVDPLHYVILRKTCGAEPLLKVLLQSPSGTRAGGEVRESTRGVIIAHADEAKPGLHELEGSVVAVPSRQLLFGFVAHIKTCKDAGVDWRSARFVVERREDRVVAAVALGRAKFGFIREGTLELLSGIIDLSKVREVSKTYPYPNPCFVCLPDVLRRRKKIVMELKEALLKLNEPSPENKRILSLAGWAGITEEVSDKEYDVVRQLLTELNLPY